MTPAARGALLFVLLSASWLAVLWHLYQGVKYLPGGLSAAGAVVLVGALVKAPGRKGLALAAALGLFESAVILGGAAMLDRSYGFIGALAGGIGAAVLWRGGAAAGRAWAAKKGWAPLTALRLLVGRASGVALGWGAALLAIQMLGGCASFGGEAKLQGYDSAGPVGKPLRLACKLEKRGVFGMNPDLEGVPVEFWRGREQIGRGITGDEGVAECAWQPAEPATYIVDVRLADGTKFHGDPGKLVIGYWKPEDPLIVVDIDHTVCDTDDYNFPTQDNREIRVIDDSPAVLARLSAKYHIVFVTGRDDTFMTKSREWLELNKFPVAPVFYMDWNLRHTDVEPFKTETIARLKKGFPNIPYGIGDRTTDAAAYLANGLRTIIRPTKPKSAYKAGTEFVATWSEVEPIIEKEGK